MKPYWEIHSQWFKTHSSIHLSCLSSGLPIERLEHKVLAWHITSTPIKILDFFCKSERRGNGYEAAIRTVFAGPSARAHRLVCARPWVWKMWEIVRQMDSKWSGLRERNQSNCFSENWSESAEKQPKRELVTPFCVWLRCFIWARTNEPDGSCSS